MVTVFTCEYYFQFELKELKRRKDEDESRRRQEEIEKATPVKSAGKSETGSIKSGSKSIFIRMQLSMTYR